MDVRKTIRHIALLFSAACFFAQSGRCENPSPPTATTVQAYDSRGHLLHTGLGFLYDPQTVVCSYTDIQRASIVRFQVEGEKGSSTRLISFNPLFNLAVLKTETEFDAEPPGSSVMIGAGEKVFYFARAGGEWKLEEASVKSFSDSGNGYEIIQVRSSASIKNAEFQSSPLYNAEGKIVAWYNNASTAVPLRAIAELMVDKEVSVPLSQINDSSRICNLPIAQTNDLGPDLVSAEMQIIEGTRIFPFVIDFPRDWKFIKSASASHYLLRVMQPAAGVCMELRVTPQQIDDLPIAIAQSETVLNSGMTRAQLAPFSGQNFSGLKAVYLDADPSSGQELTAFYGMEHRNFYVLAVRYPKKLRSQVEPLVEQIVASLRL